MSPSAGITPQQMEALVKSTHTGTGMVFKTLASQEIKTMERAAVDKLNFEIVSSVGAVGPNCVGEMCIAFPGQTFKNLVHAILGMEVAEINEECSDLSSEFLNMIFGHVKAEMKDRHKLVMVPAIPVVLFGKDLKFQPKIRVSQLVLAYDCPAGGFVVTANIKAMTS